VSVCHVTFETEYSEALKHLRLVYHSVKVVAIVENSRLVSVGVLVLLSGVSTTARLGSEVGGLINLGTFKDLGFNIVGLERNLETPLLNFFTAGDHLVELADRADTIVRLLEETLAHGSHGLFVLAHFLGDSYQHAKLGRQIDILSFLLDFKQGLIEGHNLFVVLLAEVVHHRDSLAGLSLFKAARLRAHVPAHSRNLVGFVVAVACHDNGMLKFIIDSLLNFVLLRRFSSVPLSFLSETDHLLVDQLKTVVH
jgi:hypothetical protein